VACFVFSLAVTGLYLWLKHFILNNIIAVCTAISLISLIEVLRQSDRSALSGSAS